MSDVDGTYGQAEKNAQAWFARMTADGFTDVTIELPGEPCDPTRWLFKIRHAVTEVAVPLEIHGSDPTAINWAPRTYWNGSSVSEPSLKDFAAPGFTAVKTFVPAAPSTPEGGDQT
jgi:hypothetical protein